MKHPRRALAISLVVVFASIAAQSQSVVADSKPDEIAAPYWAYPNKPKAAAPAQARAAPPSALVHVSGSRVAYAPQDLKNFFSVPDWRPGDHPTMPPVVAKGRNPDVMACGYCHLATGAGRTENASLAGLSKEYIVDQMARYRDGSRTSAVPGRNTIAAMIKIAKATTPLEDAEAARYFSSLPYRSHVRIVEASEIPEVEIEGSVYRKTSSGKREAIGQRIIEVADDFEQFEHRDPDTRYTAYVPVGSVQKGKVIAKQGAFACANCHGPGLRGSAAGPSLAGRSPTHTMRQLYDFKAGARTGDGAAGMQSVVRSMTSDDMIALSAYIGTLRPH